MEKKKTQTKNLPEKSNEQNKATKQTNLTKNPHHFCIAIIGFIFLELTNSGLQNYSAL